ncbi:complement factor H-like [Pseudonaja textilis]|uniref:complement factor H-like n=1 Tax=Pseudonaja textilis TaxID=8673 RepID=UPI000EA98107|nr:complement factor H-like [Pseudonaja textilis]
MYHNGDLIRVQCDSGFTLETDNGGKVVECTKNGWSPSPKCVTKGCDYIRIENGRMTEYLEWYKPFPKWEGQTIDFRCDHGFVPANQQTGQTWQRAACINSRYVPEPKCLKICDPSIHFDHGRFIHHDYILEGNNITFVCDSGYSPANQQSTITCTQKGWSPAPRCILTEIQLHGIPECIVSD